MTTRPPRGTHVLVHRCAGGDLGGAPGVIYRPRRCDDGAWVRLVFRSDLAGVHPFPAEDERGRDVLAYPADYERLP